ncbi:MAG: Queuine tRNA-ribosyltransferase [Chlamydiia bacterium]|nr:Queuine tRNA-ribosyltransferase [Chlamydiia bacterium]MCH9617915.1 Queuine tRNA-ribosyltransferase [Chlamydiia bacterium]MCH9624131.1 Queuine tRNA-ribosyltransferase [Chlamydiia bacterium]
MTTQTLTDFHFEVIHTSKKSGARVGKIHTPHGVIHTPGFVAVGTNGTIKALDSKMVEEIGIELMFCNTYHLLLQPGPEVIEKAGGLHTFMNRDKPLITDSGGFQVFSLAYGGVAKELKSSGNKNRGGSVLKITEDGVLFRSYRDGSKVLLTPETSIQIQKSLGADIIIPFDELPPYHISDKDLLKSFERTHRWEIRSLKEHLKNPKQQAMYNVVHGGLDGNLRKKSVHILREQPFDGFAIGGSLGKNKTEMMEILHNTVPEIPKEFPIHLLGIGDLSSLEEAIPLGIDTFDSSYPTKAARHGTLFTAAGGIKVTKAIYKDNFSPPEEGCPCHTCKNYSLAYLNHLFASHEYTAHSLASIHNLHYMVRYMNAKRAAILNDEI